MVILLVSQPDVTLGCVAEGGAIGQAQSRGRLTVTRGGRPMKFDVVEKTGEIKRFLKSSLPVFEVDISIVMDSEEISAIETYAKKTHQLEALILRHTPYIGPKDLDRQYASELTHGHVEIKRLLKEQRRDGGFKINLKYESTSERAAELEEFLETLAALKRDALSRDGLAVPQARTLDI